MESLPVEILGYIVDFAGPSSRFALAQTSTELIKCAKKANAHDLCMDAVGTGSVDFVDWILSFGYKWSTALSKCAVNGNYVAIVKYTSEKYRGFYVENARGQVNKRSRWVNLVWANAIDSDSVEMIAVAINNNVIRKEPCFWRAAKMGSVGILKMLRERFVSDNGFSFSDAYEAGVDGANIATIKWIHSNGALPRMDYGHVMQLIKDRCYEILNWVIQTGLFAVVPELRRDAAQRLVSSSRVQHLASYCNDLGWIHLALFITAYGE